MEEIQSARNPNADDFKLYVLLETDWIKNKFGLYSWVEEMTGVEPDMLNAWRDTALNTFLISNQQSADVDNVCENFPLFSNFPNILFAILCQEEEVFNSINEWFKNKTDDSKYNLEIYSNVEVCWMNLRAMSYKIPYILIFTDSVEVFTQDAVELLNTETIWKLKPLSKFTTKTMNKYVKRVDRNPLSK